MANNRIHFWNYVLNEGGQPIQNAVIRFYLNDDPTTEANIFLTETSANYTTCSQADIKTDNDGFFDFWLALDWEDGGYRFTQQFRLEWYKAGTRPGLIENVNPWPNALIWVDQNTGADRNYKNKFISDYLANKWYTHTYSIVPSASPHDLSPVDFESGCDDNVYNKVVSNKFLNDILQGCYDGDTEPIANEGVDGYTETILSTSWIASGGIYYKDITHTGISQYASVGLANTITVEKVEPKRVIFTNANTARIFVEENIKMVVSFYGEL